MRADEYKSLSVKEFTKAAEKYEGDAAGIYKMCRDDYPPILAELQKEPWHDLLDAGCGPGPMIALLAAKYPERRYTGIDLTPKMIETARKKHLSSAEFVVGDCENLPFEPESFDAVICANSFHHYPEPQKFFDSVYRVLRPNGRLILRDYTSNAALRWFANKIELPLANRVGHGDVSIYSCDEIKAFCAKSGLVPEVCEHQSKMRLHCVARKPLR